MARLPDLEGLAIFAKIVVPPATFPCWQGSEHGRTIPLTDFKPSHQIAAAPKSFLTSSEEEEIGQSVQTSSLHQPHKSDILLPLPKPRRGLTIWSASSMLRDGDGADFHLAFEPGQ